METNKQNEIRNAYEHSAQVQCIPASIKKTTEHSEEDPLVVAPYCRVSTDNKDQLASYELQCQYYKEYVSKHPGWRLYDIYADEGISGTSVKKRTDFLRMIDDCKAGKIDMIIVKNIARFARNVVDCVATVRMLKALDKPVAVYFEDIAINTLTQTGELLMVVMAAIAQGESEAKSESVKWGFQKRFEKGLPKLADLYGYTRDKRLLEIYEPEANVVRLIYQMFYDDKTIPEICYDWLSAVCAAVYQQRQNADCVAALCQRNAERDEVLYIGFYERRKAQEENDSGWKSCADGACKSRYWCRDECSVKGAGCSLRR